jgi:hypothetical protein
MVDLAPFTKNRIDRFYTLNLSIRIKSWSLRVCGILWCHLRVNPISLFKVRIEAHLALRVADALPNSQLSAIKQQLLRDEIVH